MKVTQSLRLQSSLIVTREMRLAIQMLAMDSREIEDLIEEELVTNPCVIENPFEDYGSYKNTYTIDFAQNTAVRSIDFREHLFNQVGLTRFNILEKSIAEGLIYNLSDDGLLLEYDQLVLYLSSELCVWPEWIESVRLRIMQLDPVGCGARSIHEALSFQAQLLFGTRAHAVLDLLLLKKPREAQQINAKDYVILKKLNPRPAQAFNAPSHSSFCEADLAVIKNHESFYVTLLKKSSGRIISKKPTVKALAKSFSRANFIIRSLRFRENSLQRIAQRIVEYQAPWFFKGQALKALTLKQIAVYLDLHESSVSRLVRNKYIATQSGIYELKYFFSGSVKSKNSLNTSTIAVKELIRKLINEEDQRKPISDENIKSFLQEQGFIISRRTVTKYRQALGILPAHQRRKLK